MFKKKVLIQLTRLWLEENAVDIRFVNPKKKASTVY